MNSFRYGGVHLNCLPRPQVFTLFSLFSKQPVRWFSSTFRVEAKRRMPPKKTQEKETKTLLGRPGNNLKIGIVGPSRRPLRIAVFSSDASCMRVGLPNVGKSSFFNALSETGACYFSDIQLDRRLFNIDLCRLGQSRQFPLCYY